MLERPICAAFWRAFNDCRLFFRVVVLSRSVPYRCCYRSLGHVNRHALQPPFFSFCLSCSARIAMIRAGTPIRAQIKIYSCRRTTPPSLCSLLPFTIWERAKRARSRRTLRMRSHSSSTAPARTSQHQEPPNTQPPSFINAAQPRDAQACQVQTAAAASRPGRPPAPVPPRSCASPTKPS
jgi:hypothetical protein